MLSALQLPVLLQAKVAAPKPAWTRVFTLTVRGGGTIEERLPAGGKMQVT